MSGPRRAARGRAVLGRYRAPGPRGPRRLSTASCSAGPSRRWRLRTPPGTASTLGGLDAVGLGESDALGGAVEGPTWNTYVAVHDADAVAGRVLAAGGGVLAGPVDVGPAGRWAACVDATGVPFRLWQAGRRLGAQVVNTPGAWNFSDLHTADLEASTAFYTAVFGWSFDDLGFATMIRQPGYGDHLEATSDPDIHTRQAASGTARLRGRDRLAGYDGHGEQPHWHVSFTVFDRDATAAAAEQLGGSVLSRSDSEWTREAVLRDPQGAVFTVSQFTPG